MAEIVLNNNGSTRSTSSSCSSCSQGRSIRVRVPVSFSHEISTDTVNLLCHRVRVSNADTDSSFYITGGTGGTGGNGGNGRGRGGNGYGNCSSRARLHHDLLLEMPVRFHSANEDDDDDDNDSSSFVFVDSDGNGYTSGQPVIVSSRLSSRF